MSLAMSNRPMTPFSPRPRWLRLPLPKSRRTWLVLAATAVLCGVLFGIGYPSWHNRGTALTIRFQDAHGLRVGADVRYRGVPVGRVIEVKLQSAEAGAEVHVTMNSGAEGSAREGSHFWIVRPSLSLSAGISGLDTVAGDSYLAVRPAAGGGTATVFDGDEEPPAAEVLAPPGSLSIVLKAKQKSFLRPGAGVTCCGVTVGLIQKVDLTEDGKSVRAEAFIYEKYVKLISKNTKFSEPAVVGGLLSTKPHLDVQALGSGAVLTVPDKPEPLDSDKPFPIE